MMVRAEMWDKVISGKEEEEEGGKEEEEEEGRFVVERR